MFKYYKEISDVVTLVAYCPSERSYLLAKDTSGEFWLPSSKTEKNCWKNTAQKINFEVNFTYVIELAVTYSHPHPASIGDR